MQTLSIIGAGRLGKTLGRLALQSGAFQINAVYCRSQARAREAVAFIGAGTALCSLDGLPLADNYLLSVPDDALATVAETLAHNGIAHGALAFHASGACDAALLSPLRVHGARLGSLHPAYSFADPARAAAGFAGTLCALEGDPDACSALAVLAQQLGGRPFCLAPGGKLAYHAALSIASNYLVTLTGLALSVAQQAGIEPMLRTDLIGALMKHSLENALTMGPEAALTGPIARGDQNTVARHLQVLTGCERETYLALGRATLAVARSRLTPTQLEVMQALLQ